VLIAEMLLLTALNDKGRVPVGSGALIRVGLTGALLAELAIDGRLAVAGDGTVRAGDTRPGDELLADACDAVREHLQGRNVRQVIGGLSHHIGGSWDRVAGRLTGVGVLGRDRPSLLRPARHPVLDTAARQAVLDQIRAAAAGEGPVSSQVAVVLALIGPCRLVDRVAPDPGTRGEAQRRIDRVTAQTPFAPGVATIVDELIVAITVTATTIPPSFVF
jgi:Golgi phosphoprotein 3 GPP34